MQWKYTYIVTSSSEVFCCSDSSWLASLLSWSLSSGSVFKKSGDRDRTANFYSCFLLELPSPDLCLLCLWDLWLWWRSWCLWLFLCFFLIFSPLDDLLFFFSELKEDSVSLDTVFLKPISAWLMWPDTWLDTLSWLSVDTRLFRIDDIGSGS